MSIYTALRAGVSGLSAQASALAVISDNIANVNTTAYKRGITDFSPLVNGQSRFTTYNAGGVVSQTRRLVELQGSLGQSRSPTDFAIVGDGFFVVSGNPNQLAEGGDALFTRSGSFEVDADGNMVNAEGFFLHGWPVAADGSVDASPSSLSSLRPVNVASVGGIAEPTENIAVNANLQATQTAYAALPAYTVGSLANPSGIDNHFETTIEAFDSLGAPRTMTVSFLKTGANEWAYEVIARPVSSVDTVAHPNGLLSNGYVNFNPDGTVDRVTNLPGTNPAAVDVAPFTITWAGSSGAANQTIDLDLASGLSQFAIPFSVASVTSDGVPPGDLVGLQLEGNGFLTAQFSNGRTRALFQLPVATFLAANRLEASEGGTFRTTLESGQYSINQMNNGGAGRIESGVLEASNVDLAAEFTTLITTQRAYSASARIITTSDQMLEELIAIKR
jgi:flagellar hook protein FlgE